MLKVLLSLTLVLLTSATFARSIKPSTTVAMTNQEIQLAIKLSNKYQGTTEIKSPCVTTSFEVSSYSRDFSPSYWSITTSEGIFPLDNDEIAELILLVNRVDPSLIYLDPITIERRIYIKGASCGFTPNKWTVTFN